MRRIAYVIVCMFLFCGCKSSYPVLRDPKDDRADILYEKETVCDDLPVVVKPSGVITCDYEWVYGGKRWRYQLSIPRELYEHYADRVRSQLLSHYVKEPDQRKYIALISDELSRVAESENYSFYQTVEFVLSFVQSIEYATDIISKGIPSYLRYPIETLVDGVADCKDSSILLASLLKEMNIGVALVLLSDHMAVAVAVAGKDLPGSCYKYNGLCYYYVETTGEGWGIGQVPQRYRDETVRLILL